MSDHVLEQIGPRLRAVRNAQGRTLDDVASKAGMSPSTLSRLESGKRQASLELLLPLTRELRIPLDAVIPAQTPDPRIQPSAVVHDGIRMLRLTPPNSPFQTFRMTFPARRRMPEPRVHDGHDWLYVLEGELRLVLGERELVLGPGEAAEFDTQIPHAMGSANGRPVEVISIFGADGERVHASADS